MAWVSEKSWFDSRQGSDLSLLQSVQICSGPQSASYTVLTEGDLSIGVVTVARS